MSRETQNVNPLTRSRSYEYLPPDMSELKVIVLGNRWSEQIEVGNFLLGRNTTTAAPDRCLMFNGELEDKRITIIHTPDLLFPKMDKLTEFIQQCHKLSDPGPHVFLLVLHPEDFTVDHRQKLCRVLGNFSGQSFDHSLVLITTPKATPEWMINNPELNEMIKKCRYRHLKWKNLDRLELLTRLGQIVKENNGQHVQLSVYTEEPASTTCDVQSSKLHLIEAVKAAGLRAGKQIPQHRSMPVSAFRIVLIGKSEDKKKKLAKALTCERLEEQTPMVTYGEWKGRHLTVVKTRNLISQSVEAVRRDMEVCGRFCSPRPNVLLLLVNPSDFTEENRKTLKFILRLFGEDAFKYSMVVFTHEGENETVKKLIEDCKQRQHSISHYKKDRIETDEELMQKMENMVRDNRGGCLTLNKVDDPTTAFSWSKPLNLVLFGRKGAGKTSAAEAILGQTGLHAASSSSECGDRLDTVSDDREATVLQRYSYSVTATGTGIKPTPFCSLGSSASVPSSLSPHRCLTGTVSPGDSEVSGNSHRLPQPVRHQRLSQAPRRHLSLGNRQWQLQPVRRLLSPGDSEVWRHSARPHCRQTSLSPGDSEV